MTDRYNALTVVFDKDIRSDDAERLINAIKMIKGVLSVEPNVSNVDSHIAYSKARQDISEKLWEVLREIKS